jgi:hypothetical protein
MSWKKEFNKTGNDTTVNVEISFDKEAAMETIIKMCFQEALQLG